MLMSPTVFRKRGFRFFFFSREESRPHIHVETGEGQAKVWIEPEVEIAMSVGVPYKKLTEILKIVKLHKNEIQNAWEKHFGQYRKNR